MNARHMLRQIGIGALPIVLGLSVNAQDFQLLIGPEETEWSTGSSGPVMAADGGSFLRLRMQGDHSLIKMDPEGNVSWHRAHAFTDGSNTYTPFIVPTTDGGAYLVKALLVENNNGRYAVTKIGADGATTWSKLYTIPLAPTIDQGSTGPQPVLRPDGGLDVFLRMDLTGWDEFFLMRLGPDGSVTWVQRAPVTAGITLNPVIHFAHDGVGGLCTFYQHHDLRSGLVSRFDAQGDHLWSRSVAMTNQWWNYSYPSLVAGDAGEVFVFGNQYAIGTESNYIYKLDPDGELAWYRWIDQGWPMLPVYSQVGQMVDDQIQFGGSTRLILDAGGVPLSMNTVSMPTLQSGAFELRVLPAIPHRPSVRLLVAGSWLRRDVTFGFEWRTPVYMNMPFDPDAVCYVNFSTDLPDHLLVPMEYVENTVQQAWTSATATATAIEVLDTPLPLPPTAPLCAMVGITEAAPSSPTVMLRPNLAGRDETCVLMLSVPGGYRLFTTTGAELGRNYSVATQHTISTSGLQPGCYIVRAMDAAGVVIGAERLLVN